MIFPPSCSRELLFEERRVTVGWEVSAAPSASSDRKRVAWLFLVAERENDGALLGAWWYCGTVRANTRRLNPGQPKWLFLFPGLPQIA